jgi:antitoxin ParD1/3/4
MNVSLTKELEVWVEDLVKSGMYQSSSEVIRAALRLLYKTETLPDTQLEAIKAAVKQGQADILAGRYTENHPQLLNDVKKRRSKT